MGKTWWSLNLVRRRTTAGWGPGLEDEAKSEKKRIGNYQGLYQPISPKPKSGIGTQADELPIWGEEMEILVDGVLISWWIACLGSC